MKVSYPTQPVGGGMDTYTERQQAVSGFLEGLVIAKYPNGGPRGGLFMGDADNQAAIIRGLGVAIPPATNKGHFHIGNDEFWFILEGKIAYEVEGKGLIVSQGGRRGAGAAGPLPPRRLGAGPDGHAPGLQPQPDHAAQLCRGSPSGTQ